MIFKVLLKNQAASKELSIPAADDLAARRVAIKRHVATPGYLGTRAMDAELSVMWVAECVQVG